MATMLLSAAGAAIGGATGVSVLGLSGAVIGRAAGATLGRLIDQRLLGSGSEPIEVGKIDRFRLNGASEGASIPKVFGRMRISGSVIWSTGFKETRRTSGGGKGAPPRPETTTYSYSVSIAIALCEGVITHIGRIWADGAELERDQITMRIYRGTEDQLPDPRMEAVEGAGTVPAYRGTAYVVIEDLDLAPFGNRVPQFSFEVVRPARPAGQALKGGAADMIPGVALVPGTGEYALATTKVTFRHGFGQSQSANANSASGVTDFATSLEALSDELPNCSAVSLVIGWFGDDLRAGHCTVRPKVEQKQADGHEMPWQVAELSRADASEISRLDGRPVYGGTPADASVLEAIEALHSAGKSVMFYPFLLMEILAGNGLPNPWSETGEQPALPWRGRITGDIAAGFHGSSDRTPANSASVDAFFGTVTASDFAVAPGSVSYSGPAEWSYSRFILHYAALCAAAGGVEAFCIGSEMRGLTQMRDETGFPAVARFRDLADEARALLPDAKISYAADWSEYFGYQPQDGSGDLIYHLDPLWSHDNIDFIGIDNYMPLSDWRDGAEHADVGWGDGRSIAYLQSNIEGGEGYDWYYPSEEAREAQIRVPISDGLEGKDWVYRYKDIRNWWSNLHLDRIGERDRSALVDGASPISWAVAGGATASPAGGYAGYADGALIASGGDAEDGLSSNAVVNAAEDEEYELIAYVNLGTSGAYDILLAHPAGALTISGTGNAPPSVDPGPHGVSDVEVVADGGGLRLRMILRIAADGALGVRVGPASAVAGEDVSLHALHLLRWPYPPTAWVPGSKPVRFTEFGCAAIDKGANQPNRFLDPKSAESGLPYQSTGARDDSMQAQYLRAVLDYWSNEENNPVSSIYSGRMIDSDHAYAWAWDARPWPAFPARTDLWSDGGNYPRGHWLNGRASGQPLDLVVAEVCESAQLTDYDVSALVGSVRGQVAGNAETARAQLQPLMLAHGFTAVERDGAIRFGPVPLVPEAEIETDSTALGEAGEALRKIRAPEAENVGRVRVEYVSADGEFDTRMAEAVFPDDSNISNSNSELPLVLTEAEGRGIALRWLAEARVARETIEFALPPSRRDVGAGALIRLDGQSLWRVDRVDDHGARLMQASRVEPSLREPADAGGEETGTVPIYLPPLPVELLFLDLPLLKGDESPHAPHVAAAATPWPGSVAIYASSAEDGYALKKLIETPSAIGVTETILAAADAGLWDRGPALRVRVFGATLSSASLEDVLNGANAAAIGPGSGGPWEVFQFADARLVAPDLWEISTRLRGQAGTDGTMPGAWAEGSFVVFLDDAPQQIELPLSSRGLERNYRFGPGRRSTDDASYQTVSLAFDGAGLRPYAPAHLRARATAGGLDVSWTRRTRIDGDSWQGAEVPLGEAREEYVVEVRDGSGLRRTEIVITKSWTYTPAMAAEDVVITPYTVGVAQVSESYGPGPFTRIEIND